MIGGIAVVPRNPEVSPGDPETLQGFVRAVRSGHPVDERRRRPRDRGRRRSRIRRLAAPASAELEPRWAATEWRWASAGYAGAGGLGPGGTTPACCCSGAEYWVPGAVGLSKDAISGPNLGSGAWSFVWVGRVQSAVGRPAGARACREERRGDRRWRLPRCKASRSLMARGPSQR